MSLRFKYQEAKEEIFFDVEQYYVLYDKMKSLTLETQSNQLVRERKRIIEAGELNDHSQDGIFNPGVLSINQELKLLCRGEENGNTWVGDILSSQATPIWCTLDENLKVKNHFNLTYKNLPEHYRPEDWRLFEYQGKIYANHSVYLENHGRLKCFPGISEINLEAKEITLRCLLEPPFNPSPEEKNWVVFVHQDHLLCIYSFQPYIILKINLDQGTTEKFLVVESNLNCPWHDKPNQFIASSTNPVVWDEDHYILFIHDYLEPLHEPRNRAYMQYAALISRKTLLPTSVIPEPLVMGGTEQGRHSGVHYTTSLINREDGLYAFYGEGDTHTSLVIFDKNELTKLFEEHQILA